MNIEGIELLTPGEQQTLLVHAKRVRDWLQKVNASSTQDKCVRLFEGASRLARYQLTDDGLKILWVGCQYQCPTPKVSHGFNIVATNMDGGVVSEADYHCNQCKAVIDQFAYGYYTAGPKVTDQPAHRSPFPDHQ